METKFKLAGLEMKYFVAISLMLFIAVYMEVLPKGMIGAFPLLMILGAILDYLGNKTPIVKDYLGGGPIVIIFVSAAFVYYGIFPKATVEIIGNFMGTQQGFLDFYIAALITGSILGMNRDLLIKASVKYLPVILGGVVLSILFTGVMGALLGYGFKNAIFYIAIPIMGGGMGAGAVPLSQIFGKAFKADPKQLLSVMVPAVAMGNALAIVIGGLLNKLGKSMPALSGEGKLLKTQENIVTEKNEEEKITLENLMRGIIIATTFFVTGAVLGKFINIHPYALMIITVAVAKGAGFIKAEYERCAAQWFQFVMKAFTSALLVGIGVSYTSLKEVIEAFSPTYLLLVATTVIGAIVGTAIMGHFLKFYAIEASITAGLCMANMGGTGDVAVLSAANRMELMPFAQISSRLGGAFMLILTSVLVNMFT